MSVIVIGRLIPGETTDELQQMSTWNDDRMKQDDQLDTSSGDETKLNDKLFTIIRTSPSRSREFNIIDFFLIVPTGNIGFSISCHTAWALTPPDVFVNDLIEFHKPTNPSKPMSDVPFFRMSVIDSDATRFWLLSVDQTVDRWPCW